MRRSVPIFLLLPPFSDFSVPLSRGWETHSSYFFSLARTRVYTIIVYANCLHSFTDGGEELKIRGIGVKAKVKEKSEG